MNAIPHDFPLLVSCSHKIPTHSLQIPRHVCVSTFFLPCSSQHIPLFPMLPKLLNYFIRLARVPLCLIIILNIVCAALFKYVLIALLNNPTKQWPKERAIYQPFKTRSWGGDSLERPIFQLPVLVSMAASNVMLSTSLRACWEGTANSLGFRVYLPNATSVFMQGKAPLTV